ncbi:hypothetical protein WP1_050 [Pseudomonas phage WP1]
MLEDGTTRWIPGRSILWKSLSKYFALQLMSSIRSVSCSWIATGLYRVITRGIGIRTDDVYQRSAQSGSGYDIGDSCAADILPGSVQDPRRIMFEECRGLFYDRPRAGPS